jgi:hypothetical protein
MTTRRLSIEVKCDPLNESGKHYSKVIKNREIPRGIPISVTYYITNMDNQSYSVYIAEISARLVDPISRKTFAISKDVPQEGRPGKIEPKTKTELHISHIQMPVEGNAEFECILKPYNNNEEIEYFTNDGKVSLGKESWKRPFKVIAREQLEIIELLKEIRDNTNKLINKS